MLTLSEKIVFIILLIIALYLSWHAFQQVARIIRRGAGRPPFDQPLDRIYTALIATLTQRTVLNARPLTSLVHFSLVWGFLLYALVNLEDVLRGFIPGYHLFTTTALDNIYRLAVDVFSVVVIVAMIYFLIRRFGWRDPNLMFNSNILLHEEVRAGAIQRDSALVGAFILTHVGSRFLGQSISITLTGPDAFQPFATVAAGLWVGANPAYLDALLHIFWWLAIGSLLIFIPWFPQTKHFHLIMAPLNILTQPGRRGSSGTMTPLDLEDESIEMFGAAHLEHLSQSQIMDAYACIMCNRCQEVCPATNAGTPLSPAALEINKRYFIKTEAEALAAGQESVATLFDIALPAAGVWACTACAACLEICPVGNEPLHDILNMRQYLTLMEGDIPEPLAVALTQAERSGDPWGNPANTRLDWAKGLDVPLLADKQQVDVL
ncbi:4Fe-4S dicluster domain-containing protein, partial [Chloroflexota bacterium]